MYAKIVKCPYCQNTSGPWNPVLFDEGKNDKTRYRKDLMKCPRCNETFISTSRCRKEADGSWGDGWALVQISNEK